MMMQNGTPISCQSGFKPIYAPRTIRLQRRIRHIHGFTLIELLVAISIIALLVSILLPSLQKAKDLAKRSVCASTLKNNALVFFLYQNDYTFLPHSYIHQSGGTEYIGATGLYTLGNGVATALYDTYGLTRKYWHCPAQKISPRLFWEVGDGPPSPRWDFAQLDHYAIYTYLNGSNPTWAVGGTLHEGQRVASHDNQGPDEVMLGDANYCTSVTEKTIFSNHAQGGEMFGYPIGPPIPGWNNAYGDGHVEWIVPENEGMDLTPADAAFYNWMYFYW